MAKASLSRFVDRQDAQTFYLAEVDVMAVRSVNPIHDIKYQQAKIGKGKMLEAEAQALGKSVAAVARSIREARAKWLEHEALVEAQRIKVKADIRQASNAEAMRLILEQFKLFLQG